MADERLFATLDPRTRRFALPGGEPVLVSDTVGFVRKLPHQLVEAFRSTLEVVNEADLLVHLVDSSAPEPEGQIDAVRPVLGEIGAGDIPELVVFNKADLAPDEAQELAIRYPGAVVISAATGTGHRRPPGGHGPPAPARPAAWSNCPSPTAAATSWPPCTGRVRCWRCRGSRGDDGPGQAAGCGAGQFAPFLTARDASDRGRYGGPERRRLRTGLTLAWTSLRPDGETAGERGARWPVTAEAPAGFQPPPYPYERLASLGQGRRLPGGGGRPVRGQPLRPSQPGRAGRPGRRRRGRGDAWVPLSAGSPAARPAAADWMGRRLGPSVDPGARRPVHRHQRTGGRPSRLAAPARPVPGHGPLPGACLPDLRDGSSAGGPEGRAGARRRALPPAADAGRRQRGRRRAGAGCCGSTAPATRPGSWTTWPPRQLGPPNGACWWPATSAMPSSPGTAPPRPSSGTAGERTGLDGVLAVHSLSKRSNLAGLRFGWYTGDAEVVRFVRDVRQHAGFMVPGRGPARRDRRSGRPGSRRRPAAALPASVWPGCGEVLSGRWGGGADARGRHIPLGAGPGGTPGRWRPAWRPKPALSSRPGEFYGPAGAGHMRVAAVAPMERIELVASRLGA